MICKDLLDMKEFNKLRLVAGEEGLNRAVRWVYFADTLEFTEDMESLESWTYGGEIFVVTNERMLANVEKMLEIMRRAYEHNISAIVINVGLIRQEYIDFANEKGLPLFEIPWSIRLIDLSQKICTRLIKEQNAENTLEHLLSSIIYTGYESEEDVIFNALYYGFDLRQPLKIAIFDIDIKQYAEKNNITSEEKIKRINAYFLRSVRSEFLRYNVMKTMSITRYNSVIVLFPEKELDKNKFGKLVSDIDINLQFAFPKIKFFTGVGNSYSKVSEIKKSFVQASKTVKVISSMFGDEKNVLYFDELGIYSLLFSVSDETELEVYYKNIIGSLIEYDNINNSQLCNTLEEYLANNKNSNITAEKLFIHRNTLRYRLDKIKNILNIDLEDLSDLVQYIIAFQIKRYLEVLDKKA